MMSMSYVYAILAAFSDGILVNHSVQARDCIYKMDRLNKRLHINISLVLFVEILCLAVCCFMQTWCLSDLNDLVECVK